MGLFSKKKKNDFFLMLEDMDDSAILDTQPSPPAAPTPSHMLTPDEILSDFGGEIDRRPKPDGDSDPLEHVRRRMMQNRSEAPAEQVEQTAPETAVPAEPQDAAKAPAEPVVPPQRQTVADAQPPQSQIDFMSLFGTKEKPQTAAQTAPQGAVREKGAGTGRSAAPQTGKGKIETESPAQESLLHKCMPYIVDDEGNDVSLPAEPLYQLESVADILRSNSERTLEKLSRKYDVTLDDLGRGAPGSGQTPPERKKSSPEPHVQTAEQPSRPPQTEKTAPRGIILDGEPIVFDDELPQISDIDTKTAPKAAPENTEAGSAATIRFTPIRNEGADAEHMSVSTITRTIDLTGELNELSLPENPDVDEMRLEQSEFETFQPSEESADPAAAKRLIAKLSRVRRRAFLQTVFSLLLLAVCAAFLIPVFSDVLIRAPRTGMAVCTGLLAAATLINADIFASFKTLFSRRSSCGAPASLCSLSLLALGVVAAVQKANVYELLLVGMLILSVRAFCRFRSASAMVGNLRQAVNPRPKKAVTLITDEATAFAMAKSAVEGDALIAAPRETGAVDDFMKYAEYAPVLDGRMRFVSLGALLLSIVTGFAAAAFFHSALSGLYTAAVVLSAAACPALFLIDSLPLGAAAGRLNKKGAFIAGRAAANRLEMANAAVLSAQDIFPEGTVTMQSVKVLCENSFDANILRAASLTEAVGSPLAPIFKRIAGTGAGYTIPDSETVKYEDRLGLSGWVDDELLFIGNRTLMQAHGIAVPDIEVDRKILRRGFFPVYLGVGNKACALIVVRYDVDPQVVYELRRLTGLGVTLLINNCDPNLTEEMICDYLGLYGDSVKIMSNSGVHMYKNAVIPCERCSAPAAFRGNPLNFISVLNCASRIKRSTRLLTVFYALALCIGTVLFVYLSFLGGAAAPVGGMQVLLAQLGVTVVSFILFLISKP